MPSDIEIIETYAESIIEYNHEFAVAWNRIKEMVEEKLTSSDKIPKVPSKYEVLKHFHVAGKVNTEAQHVIQGLIEQCYDFIVDKPSESAYMAAIRCIKEYCQNRPDSTMIGVFRAWCEDNHRLKVLMEQEKE